MTLLGPENHMPFPDVARFPGEPKLVGVPHSTKESLFSDTHVCDALEALGPFYAANSDAFRQEAAKLAGGLTTHRLMRVHTGLEKILSQGLCDEDRGRRIASTAIRLQGKMVESVAAGKPESSTVSENPSQPDYMLMDENWRTQTPDFAGSHLPIPEKVNRWCRDVALRSALKKLEGTEVTDQRLAVTGYHLYQRFVRQIDERKPQNPGPLLDGQVGLALLHATSQVLFRPGDNHPSMYTRYRINRGIAYGIIDRWSQYDIPTIREALDTMKDSYTDRETGKLQPFISAEILVLESWLVERQQLESYLKRYTGEAAFRIGQTLLKSQEQENADMADALMGQVIALRKYGIKTALKDSSTLLAKPNEKWVVRAPMSELIMPDTCHRMFDPAVAYFDLTPTADIQSLQLGAPDVVSLNNAQAIGYEVEYGMSVSFGLSAKGELIASSTTGVIMPLKPYFEKIGAGGVYQALRLHFANILYDLIVPETGAEQTMSSKQPQNTKGLRGLFDRIAHDPYSAMQKLTLPRIRYLEENADNILEELERNTCVGGANESERTVRLHGVVCFVRRLPKGYSSSPAAKMLAARAGIRLDDGETFVRAHERGNRSKGVVTGHIIKQ